MTVSLTFDDGLRAHKTIAAPLLEKYGWTGAFNVCTDFLDPNPETLTEHKLDILGLRGHSDARMNWADAIQLLKGGHEVYPHGCSHEDLGSLWKAGEQDVVRHEIHDSIAAYRQHIGRDPRFFCCPHLAWTVGVRDLIHDEHVEMFNNVRLELGTGDVNRVVDLLFDWYYWGRSHVDLMFHGIVAREGGFRPFADEAEFESVLATLKRLEEQGKIKVVPYSKSHKFFPVFPEIRECIDYRKRRMRHIACKLISMSCFWERFRWK